MIRIAAAILALVACGRSSGVPDDQLGGLVHEVKAPEKVDVDQASKDPAELSRAMALPYTAVIAAVGPHSLSIDTKTVVDEAGKPVSELTDHAALELGETGTFHGVYTNSADYGREATYLGGKLYLRPRYQRWHVRAPEAPEEPGQIRDLYFAAIAATWDLVAPGAEITDRGAATVAGRAGRKIEVKLAPTAHDNPREELSQRRWREGRTVESLSGEVILDADTGVPLAAKLAGSVTFMRDGRRFVMKLELDAKLTAVGVVAIAAPPEAEVVATPTRKHEVDERDYLLQGIAPSIRKNADGTAIKPSVAPAAKP
ncbi:MAG: hypothetical protein ABI867_45395 [Kofleriaceae bacterium]